jgi:hypothetical protein
MKHKSIIKEYYDKNFITATASETKKISVQYPYKTKNTFYGSGLEKEILISEGQSYIFINSQNTAEYEINATLLSNTKISDKITAVFKKKTRAELSLYHYDNGPVKFSYDELNSNNYSLLSSEITSKKGFPFNDYLVIALPENWTFLYPERKNFIKNFSLAINSKEISEKYLEQNSEIISGTVKDNSVQRNYAAVKLNIKPGYSYKFTVKSRPSEKANPSDESKIYSSNSFLLNHKLSAVNPLTLIKGEKKELSHEFSDLNIFFNSLNENNSELVLKNNGNGTIKILNTAVNYLNNINDNRIFIRPDSVQEGKFYNNYLQNPFEFILTGKESEAKIIFSRKNVYKSVPDFYITYEISRIDSTGKKISSIDTLIFSQNSGNTE